MKVMVWNCQGAGSPLTVPQLREFNTLLSPDMILMSETKNKQAVMYQIQKKVGMENRYVVDAVNKAGGMAFFWTNSVQVKEVQHTDFTIEILIEDGEARLNWWLVSIYASCEKQVRKKQWDIVTERKKAWGDKVIIIGDFNDIKCKEEKWGGRDRDEWTFTDFREFIRRNTLVDIGYEGLPWTWRNSWDEDFEIKERLDRGFCTPEWLEVFANAKCTHVENWASDHSILLLDTCPANRRRKRRFYFDKRWVQYEEVHKLINDAWNTTCEGSKMYKVTKRITSCRIHLLKWHKRKIGNAKKKIAEIKEELEKKKKQPWITGKGEIANLKTQLTKAYQEEEMFWSQKARLQWLREGDKNTKYFHAVVNGRRRACRMNQIQKGDGSWTKSEQEVGKEIANYYRQLFTASIAATREDSIREILEGIPTTITEQMNKTLIKFVDEKD
ncbi:uncharacterized protein [Coffea arabica]|uniref:Endonuclease/exonuclease/phosphatase domain-containing protein n=1 Tax=Coffea arabica TaxID=13443 RepID=A0ABM4U665_COFAR